MDSLRMEGREKESAMSSQITNYRCPACGAPVRFAGESGKLQCDYCGSTFSVAEMEQRMAAADAEASGAFQDAADSGAAWDTSELGGEWGADAGRLRTYACPACGAELLCDETTAATSCPYCGNNAIVPGQFSGALKPDLLLPFRLDKQAAVEALKKHYRGKLFLAKAFSSENHIEKVQGVYIPFWLFDGTADADVRFAATKESSHREGEYEVTTIRHYDVRRCGSVRFEKVPVDASRRMPDDLMDSVEPFDYGALEPFSTAFLPGFLADRYDVTAEESSARANVRCANTAVEMLEDTVQGYTSHTLTEQNVRLQRGKVHYALLPVWLLDTKWKGKDFLFAMNAQTGRLAGNLPVSRGRVFVTFLTLFVSLAALFGWLFWRFGGGGEGIANALIVLALAAGIAGSVCAVFLGQMRSVRPPARGSMCCRAV